MQFPDLSCTRWQDAENNPVIGYFHGEKARYAIGDPQVLTPEDYDGRWHMFYHGFFDDYIPYLYHVVSEDGLKWEFVKRWQINVGPVYLFRDGGRFILYSSEVLYRDLKAAGLPKEYAGGVGYTICARTSEDLEEWSAPHTVLTVDLPWETVGPEACVRNPCVIRLPDGRYRMYYSGGSVRLPICGYPEPAYIGIAESKYPLGGFIKNPTPILAPDSTIPYRNFGCGGFKVYGYEDKYLALYNPIYMDKEGKPRSCIAVMLSNDGITWQEAPYNPIILPDTADWKKALVYQLDCVMCGDELRIYYNARDEWLDGIERIGLSVLKDAGIRIRKLV
ncbi:MAG: hypothetical protein IKL89_00450 [Clostridia bacterium]|nr:hypothetical protein [Clostridia bacterium]